MEKLRVVGNRIVNSLGSDVKLRGVCRPLTEDIGGWAAGKKIGEDDFQVMAGWRANVVRLSFDMAWASDAGYLQIINDCIGWAEKYGMYMILDCHCVNGVSLDVPPEAVWIAMWTAMANRHKDKNHVLFQIYNEPHDGDADWYNMATRCIKAIRATGAQNIIIVPARHYCHDGSGALAWYSATNPGNVAISLHLYIHFTKWQIDQYGGTQQWLDGLGWTSLKAVAPVIVTETGVYANDPNEILWLDEFLNICEAQGYHYTPWAFFPFPNWNFGFVETDWVTPTATGIVVKEHLPTPISPLMSLAWLTAGLAPIITVGGVVTVQELKKIGVIP